MPYLEAGLGAANRIAVRTSCARELMVAERASGYRFAAAAIEENATYKSEMVQTARERFPELRGATEAEIARFLRGRL